MSSYRFEFSEAIDLDEIASTLLLASMATESLHGPAQVRLDAPHVFDRGRRQCLIDANTPVGRDLSRLFAGYLLREFDEDSFCVRHCDDNRNPNETITPNHGGNSR